MESIVYLRAHKRRLQTAQPGAPLLLLVNADIQVVAKSTCQYLDENKVRDQQTSSENQYSIVFYD